ncbi:MAG: tripartite tricarboxylate transporter substrate binding protein [Betaproteobacteria bacterium]|nr:MAG: tripartite tricarboxylate transporter substrate binding protein [Betaproteobacteria bacterium]
MKSLLLSAIFTALGIASLIAMTSVAIAQPYPNKSIRLIVPFPPGGATDIIGRTLAQKLSAQLGQAVVVDNKPGAGGTLGSTELTKAAPDGYTLLLATTSTHSIAPSLYKSIAYTVEKDFAPIGEVATATNVLIVTNGLAAKDVRELIALAKAEPNKLNFASSGNGTVVHLQSELFKLNSGTQITHVPYKGTALAIPDLISGQTQMLFDSIVSALPHIKGGKVRALAVTSAKRSSLLPNVPTVAESGLPDYVVDTYFGLYAPAATPRDIVDRLQREMAAAVQSAEVKERFASQGAEPVGGTSAALSALMKTEADKWRRVITAGQIKID